MDIKDDDENESEEFFEIVIVNATIRYPSGTEVNLSEEQRRRLSIDPERILILDSK